MKKASFLFVALVSVATVFAQEKSTTKTKKHHHKHKTELSAKETTTGTTAVAAVSSSAADKEEKRAEEMKGSQPSAATTAPIEFTESKHTFGKIKQGTPVTYVFTFKNTSANPVIIENATAQCGCTTPDYPKSPVAKGGKGEIKVTYNAAAIGNFTKQVTVRVAKYDQPIILTIDGEVMAPATPADDKKEPGK